MNMKEKSLICSAHDVRAILEGRKTQARRVVKPQPPEWATKDRLEMVGKWAHLNGDHPYGKCGHARCLCSAVGPSMWTLQCPYGQPGDRLWVRETFEVLRETCSYEAGDYDAFPWEEGMYGLAKDMLLDKCPRGGHRAVISYRADGEDVIERWKPSIHMPRWASRITLEVVSARVERLQEISEDDAEAEGIFNSSGLHDWDCMGKGFHPDQLCHCGDDSIPETFRRIWEYIKGKGSWDANPWVWVVEFKKINPS